MDAPLGPRRARAVERHVEVREVAESVGLLFDDLVQVCRISEWTQLGGDATLPDERRSESAHARRAQLHAPDLDARGPQPLERRRGILVLDGEVTAVEADPDVVLKMAPRIVGADPKLCGEDQRADREQPLLEERDRLVRVLENAVRLWLDVEVDEGAVLAPDAHERVGDADDVPCHRLPRLDSSAGHPGLVRQWRGRDAAIEPYGQQRPQDLDQIERVVDPGVVPPVGRVDVGLDWSAVKRSVREAVDDGDIQTLAIEVRAKLAQPVALEQFARLARREPQPHAKWLGRREARLERRRVFLQVREYAVPPVSGVDVGAVGEVKGTGVDLQSRKWR